METQVFWDIFSTPEQMNSEKWKIKRCTGMKKHLTRGKEYDQHWKLGLDPPEKKRMENVELKASLVSSWESPDKNIDGKRMDKLRVHKMDTWLRYLSPWRKGWEGGGKTKTTWDERNKHRWENLELILRMGRMMGSSRREAHRLEKN